MPKYRSMIMTTSTVSHHNAIPSRILHRTQHPRLIYLLQIRVSSRDLSLRGSSCQRIPFLLSLRRGLTFVQVIHA
jgi:hypothetical protein